MAGIVLDAGYMEINRIESLPSWGFWSNDGDWEAISQLQYSVLKAMMVVWRIRICHPKMCLFGWIIFKNKRLWKKRWPSPNYLKEFKIEGLFQEGANTMR